MLLLKATISRVDSVADEVSLDVCAQLRSRGIVGGGDEEVVANVRNQEVGAYVVVLRHARKEGNQQQPLEQRLRENEKLNYGRISKVV